MTPLHSCRLADPSNSPNLPRGPRECHCSVPTCQREITQLRRGQCACKILFRPNPKNFKSSASLRPISLNLFVSRLHRRPFPFGEGERERRGDWRGRSAKATPAAAKVRSAAAAAKSQLPVRCRSLPASRFFHSSPFSRPISVSLARLASTARPRSCRTDSPP